MFRNRLLALLLVLLIAMMATPLHGCDSSGENQGNSTVVQQTNTPPQTSLPSDGVIKFKDPALEAAIREKIGQPTGDIKPSDLEKIEGLTARVRGIRDLTGIQFCTSLTYLDLLGNEEISDISPLATLTGLTTLRLQGCSISDISPLSHLTHLQLLKLGSNSISDISPLSHLMHLEDLDLYSNGLSDISPLSALGNLAFLDLTRNAISDISPLSNLTKLKNLSLAENRISDITPLTRLVHMTSLGIDFNEIVELSPLSGLTELTWLDLSFNQITDISPLVMNEGLGIGDKVALWDNPLTTNTPPNQDALALRARRVIVAWYSVKEFLPQPVRPPISSE